MKNWICPTLIAATGAAILAAATLTAGHVLATKKMQREVPVKVAPIPIPTEAAAIARGAYLYASRGCADCHGAGGGGRLFIDIDGLKAAGPHIGPGPGSVTAQYRSEDWVRTIRHSVKPDGRPAMLMPSEDYNRFTDADLGALVAYLQQLPSSEGGTILEMSLAVRVLYALGRVQDAAEKIDHNQPPSKPVPEGPAIAHGRYVASVCVGCHGACMTGGKIPGTPPDWPAAANLTHGPGSGMTPYTDAASFA